MDTDEGLLPPDGIPLPSPDLAFPPEVDPFLLYAAHRQRMAPPSSVGGAADVSRRMSAFAHRPSRGLSVKMLTPLSPDKMVGLLPPLESLEKHLGLTVVAPEGGGHGVVPDEPHSRPHPAAAQTLLLGRSYPAPPVLQALLSPPAPVNRLPRDPSVVLARNNHGTSWSSTSLPVHTDQVSSVMVRSSSSPPPPHIKAPVMGTPSRRTDLPPILLLQHAMKQAEPPPLVRSGNQNSKSVLNAFAPLLVDHVPVPPPHLLTRASIKREPVMKLVAGAASKSSTGSIVFHNPEKQVMVGRPGTNQLLPGAVLQHVVVKSVQPSGHSGHSHGYSVGTFGHGPAVPVPLMAYPAEILQSVSPPVPYLSRKVAGTRTLEEAWSPSKKDAPVFAPIGERPNWM